MLGVCITFFSAALVGTNSIKVIKTSYYVLSGHQTWNGMRGSFLVWKELMVWICIMLMGHDALIGVTISCSTLALEYG
jgi:hypothetical protein